MTDNAKPERWWRYRNRRRIICPNDHHFDDDFQIPESGFVRCEKRMRGRDPKTGEHTIPGDHGECGKWIFILAVRKGGVMIFEVRVSEMREMEREELTTPHDILDYLIGERAARIALKGTPFG